MNNNALVLSPQQSKNINLLKGLSIVLVVFIHADVRSQLSRYMEMGTTMDVYMETLTRILVDNAVPMFYFVSGFLFFLHKASYSDKFKSRIRTLVVPYLFWCFVGFLIPFVIQRLLGLERLYSGTSLKLLKDFSAPDYIRMFWDIRDGDPILSTLWFLRNLIVLVAFTPVIAWLAKHLRFMFPAMLLVTYFFFPWSVPGFSTNGFCWFAMGAYFSVGGVNCWKSIENANTRVISLLWSVLLVAVVTAYSIKWHYEEVMLLFRIVHFVMVYKVVVWLSGSSMERLFSTIAAASFFIYVFHEPWMGYIVQLTIKELHPTGLVAYFMPLLFAAVTMGYSYAAYAILQHMAPAFLNVITGARAKRKR